MPPARMEEQKRNLVKKEKKKNASILLCMIQASKVNTLRSSDYLNGRNSPLFQENFFSSRLDPIPRRDLHSGPS